MSMEVLLTFFFFLFIFLILWIYLGYFIVSSALVIFFRRRKMIDENFLPTVTIIVPAYNEEKVIRQKIQNTLALDYPSDKFETIIVSDNSTDRTVEFIQPHLSDKLRLIQRPDRMGKSGAIDLGITNANGEIVIITDANATLEKDVLRKIVRHFTDTTVGGVTGSMQQIDVSKTTISKGGDLYWKYETRMRTNESSLYSVISMSGEISACRKSIFLSQDGTVRPWYVHGGTDDFQMTIFIIRKGYRVLYEPEAHVWEPAPNNVRDLFSQKTRIITQTIVNVKHDWRLIFNVTYGLYGPFIFLSRRVLSLFSPFLLFCLLVATLFLSFYQQFFLIFLVLQILFYGIGSLGVWNIFSKNFLVRNIYFFLLLNATIFMGWVKYFQRKDFTRWDKIESSRIASTP